jgi:hypothetical protein
MSVEGGCFCGAVRYVADGDPLRVMHCHCTICRRTSGAPVVTWITYPMGAFRWTKGTPAGVKSTANATRNFCAKCGSHMAFIIDGAKELDITVGTLDNPLDYAPMYHIFNDTRIAWFKLEDGLPAYDDWGPNV